MFRWTNEARWLWCRWTTTTDRAEIGAHCCARPFGIRGIGRYIQAQSIAQRKRCSRASLPHTQLWMSNFHEYTYDMSLCVPHTASRRISSWTECVRECEQVHGTIKFRCGLCGRTSICNISADAYRNRIVFSTVPLRVCAVCWCGRSADEPPNLDLVLRAEKPAIQETRRNKTQCYDYVQGPIAWRP